MWSNQGTDLFLHFFMVNKQDKSSHGLDTCTQIMLFYFFSWCVQTLVGFPTVKDNSGFIHNTNSIEKLPCSSLKPQKFKNKVKVKYLE